MWTGLVLAIRRGGEPIRCRRRAGPATGPSRAIGRLLARDDGRGRGDIGVDAGPGNHCSRPPGTVWGQLGTSKRSEDRIPSTTTALKSTSDTAPAPLVVYQRSVSFISGADQDPPETAMPEPDDELTGVGEAWRPVDEVPVDVELLAMAPDDVVVVPGIVYALTAPRRPTPATAPKASPAVRRLSVLVAASRAWIRLSPILSFSMIPTWRAALNASCEKRGSLLRSNVPAGKIRRPLTVNSGSTPS
jgi:hypothetical protein